MEDKRQFNRWSDDACAKAVVTCDAVREEAPILDMSAGGMRVVLHHSINIGSVVYGQFNVLEYPYYIKGVVNRLVENQGSYETAITFDKVSSLPLA